MTAGQVDTVARLSISQARKKKIAAAHGVVFDSTLRCDRCEARAYSWILLDPDNCDTQLSFCGHHFKESKVKIKAKYPNSVILDLTQELLVDDELNKRVNDDDDD